MPPQKNKRTMKRTYAIAAFTVSMCLFGSCRTAPNHVTISPVEAMTSVDNLSDGVYPVSFSSDDFEWDNGKLRFVVYQEDFYDSVQVTRMKAGDTLVYQGEKIVVDKIDARDNFLTVNNGLEEGGAYMQKITDGRYRGMQLDDHSTYTKIGNATMPLADGFTLVDCGENPTDEPDSVSTGQREYLAAIKDYKHNFTCLETRITVSNGKVTKIERKWIP